MANFRLNVDKAVFDTLNVAGVVNVATGGVFNTMARRDVSPPYVIFQAMSKVDEHSFNGRFGNAVYMVKAVSRSPWPKEAEDVDTQVDTVMEDASLSITGYTRLLCRREQDFYLVEDQGGERWQHVGGLYRIIADQV